METMYIMSTIMMINPYELVENNEKINKGFSFFLRIEQLNMLNGWQWGCYIILIRLFWIMV